jgi:hypothetical protein
MAASAVLIPFNRRGAQGRRCFVAYGNLAGRSGQRRILMASIKKIILGTALAATSLAVAAPASAQDYARYHRHSGDTATAAIVTGVIGLAVGAAIASSSNRGYDNYNYAYRNGGWYDGYQYRNGGFYDRQGYRRYDRNTWHRRHHNDGDRSYDRGGYDRRDRDDDDRYEGRNQYGNGYYQGGYNAGAYGNGGYYTRGY